MEFALPQLDLALAEIVLASGVCLVLLVDLFVPQRLRDVTYIASLIVIAATAYVAAGIGAAEPLVTFSGNFVIDPMGRLLKLFACATVAAVFVYSRPYLRDRDLHHGEYYLLGLFALLGIQVMISASSFLTLYLGLEMLSLALYAMVAFDRDSPIAAESAVKYFVLGAIASGCLLYGMSLLYGLTGSLELAVVNGVLEQDASGQLVAIVGLTFVLVGVAFKFGAVPFHMWLPDVYQGAPTSVTLFIGTAPKIAAFALAVRLLYDGMGALAPSWELLMSVLAVLSLGIGNVIAIVQTNIKRMLAYSTIGHVGFIFLGLLTGAQAGLQSAMFYTLVYVAMALGAFGIVILVSRRGFEAEELDHYKGMGQQCPWFAAIMLLLMVSMIGVPPLAGFYAKWWVLSAVIDAGYLWLAVVAVIFSVIGAFYYLRVIKLMYFDAADREIGLQNSVGLRWTLSLNGLAVLVLGLFPDTLMDLCMRAFA